MAKRYPTPRFWKPKNPLKYVGDPNNIVSRSSWEIRFMNYCDSNPNIINWNSEDIKIPYVSPIDNALHNYHVDFIIKVNTKSGTTKTYLVEIKPYEQTIPPKITKNKKQLMESTSTYLVNQAKWKAASAFAIKNGWEFICVTEYELGLKTGSR